jgi:hypothetical protein
LLSNLEGFEISHGDAHYDGRGNLPIKELESLVERKGKKEEKKKKKRKRIASSPSMQSFFLAIKRFVCGQLLAG